MSENQKRFPKAVSLTLLVAALALPSLRARAESAPLTLRGFLGEVRENNFGMRAHGAESDAANRRSREGELLFTPQLLAETGWLDDRKQTLNPLLYGTETRANTYSIGVQEQTRYGTKAKLSTNLNYFSLNGINPAFIPLPTFYTGSQMLEVTQSILRNGFGSELRAQEDAARSQAKAEALNESYQAKVQLATAEIDYWKLAASRRAVQVRRDNLERAKRLEAWSARREDRGLGHKSDVYQARSAVRLAELELQQALDDERAAAWSFNSDRGRSDATVDETLDELVAPADIAAPARHGDSEQVLAAEQASKAAAAKALLEVEKVRPSLDVYGALALNGKDPRAGTAWTNSLSTAYPTMAAGVKLAIPLDFGLVSELKQASAKSREAAEWRYQQARLDEERQWKDLSQRFEETKHRLELAAQIEQLQQQKYQNERDQHGLGMTTTYQVLTFEDDYARAQLQRLQLHAELLSLVAKMKIFGGAL